MTPLDPSGAEGRSWLRRELVRPEYHEDDPLRALLAWLERTVGRGVDVASQLSPLRALAAMVVALVLVVALVALLSRARRSAGSRPDRAPLLPEDRPDAARLRERAEAALALGRPGDALVDGFRALAVRQVERGRLEDTPGATAHEVAAALGASYPGQRERVDASAALFERVLYGHRPASHDQAAGVLALDDELAGRR